MSMPSLDFHCTTFVVMRGYSSIRGFVSEIRRSALTFPPAISATYTSAGRSVELLMYAIRQPLALTDGEPVTEETSSVPAPVTRFTSYTLSTAPLPAAKIIRELSGDHHTSTPPRNTSASSLSLTLWTTPPPAGT